MELARYATGRDKFIAFLGSFHGRTMGSLSLTASRSVQRKGFGTLLGGVFHAPYPNPYRTGQTPEEAAAASLRFIKDTLFRHLVSPDEVAGLIVEPVQGEGGYLVPPPICCPRSGNNGPARHSVDRGRGTERDGSHGSMVGLRALRHRSGHHQLGQRHRQRSPAQRHHRSSGPDDLETGCSRLHLRRQSCRDRRFPCNHRFTRAWTHRQCPPGRHVYAGPHVVWTERFRHVGQVRGLG